MSRTVVFASLLTILCSGPVLAQGHSHSPAPATQAPASGHGNHGAHMGAAHAGTAATQAYRQANDRMHKDMDIAYSGNADVDFVKGMIPHHQGAIDMAKVVLAHGKNAEIRKLAEHVIKEQEGEIATMRAWLKANGH